MASSDWQVAHGAVNAEIDTRYASDYDRFRHTQDSAQRPDAGPPPPQRADYELGNEHERRQFHKDRKVWYLHHTGTALTGSLTEQNEAFDLVARNYRVRKNR